MRPSRWILLGVAVLLLALVGMLTWVLNSQAGARWAVDGTVAALGGKLSIQSVEGRIVGPLDVRGLHYRDPQGGKDVRIKHASVNVDFTEFLRGRLHIEAVTAWGIGVSLSEPTEKKEPKAFSLQPPIDILLDHFTFGGLRIARDGQPLLVVRRGFASGQWTDDGIAVHRLDLSSPQGKVHLKGQVGKHDAYVGQLAGRFTWRQGKLTYAGKIEGHTEGRQATVVAQITAPLAARLDVTFEQQESLPWRFALQVPRFDPRSNLMPDSSLESLAASLTGKGDKSLAEVRGILNFHRQR